MVPPNGDLGIISHGNFFCQNHRDGGHEKRIQWGSFFLYLVAGIRCEVQQWVGARDIVVIPLSFEGPGRAMGLAGVGAPIQA